MCVKDFHKFSVMVIVLKNDPSFCDNLEGLYLTSFKVFNICTKSQGAKTNSLNMLNITSDFGLQISELCTYGQGG